MSVKNRNSIVTDGLVFYVDAGNEDSYAGSGTTWSDLSGSNDGALTNGPTYDSGNGGSIAFDGVNDSVLTDYIPVNTNTSEGNTVEQWIYWNGNFACMPFSWFDIKLDMWFQNNGFGINNGNSLLYGTSSAGLANNWIHYACFFPNNWSTRSGDAKLWINGIGKSMTKISGSFANRTIPSSARISIGSGYDRSIRQNFQGKIGITKIYNRELTPSEVTQNYNALKNRFI